MKFNPKEILSPSPIMKLSHVQGFTGRVCPDIRWNPNELHSKDLIYADGELLICINT